MHVIGRSSIRNKLACMRSFASAVYSSCVESAPFVVVCNMRALPGFVVFASFILRNRSSGVNRHGPSNVIRETCLVRSTLWYLVSCFLFVSGIGDISSYMSSCCNVVL